MKLRCGDCPGCRKFEANRLAQRFAETYRQILLSGGCQETSHKQQSVKAASGSGPRLSAVRIYAPKEKHASMSRQIHRWRGVKVDGGIIRAGVDSFIVLTWTQRELCERLRKRGQRVDAWPIRKPHRAQSYGGVVRGMNVPRSAYGPDIDRYYRRNLARLEKYDWKIIKTDKPVSFDRATSPRVISESHGKLIPTEELSWRRGLRTLINNLERRATTPEAVEAIAPEVRELARKIGNYKGTDVAPLTDEQKERNRQFNLHFARTDPDSSVNAKPSDLSPPQLVGGVTEDLANFSSSIGDPMSSIHSSGAPPPQTREQIRADSDKALAEEQSARDFIAQRAKKNSTDAIASLHEKWERRSREESTRVDNSGLDRRKP